MEQKIERCIDNFLENAAPILYKSSVVIGNVLILLGIILLLKKSARKNCKLYGIICISIGIVATISGFLQGGF